MKKRKIALFGGTFDPIHLGHTTVANDAADCIGAEKVIFVPAKRSPLKGFMPKANDKARLEMIVLATKDEQKFKVSDYELKKPAPSYTLETVEKFVSDYGSETSIYWLIGADSINDLSKWYKITELIDICNIATMYRAGCKPPDFNRFEAIWGRKRVEKLNQNIVKTSLIDISSTDIRKGLTTNLDISNMVHPAVAEYILKHDLYKS